MDKIKIFIVEDDPFYRELLAYQLGLNPDYAIETFEKGKECLDALHENPTIVSIDFSLPDMTGKDLIKKIKNYKEDIPIIVISAQEEISVAVELMKMGIADYLVKNESTKDLLWNSIIRIRETLNLKEEVETLRNELIQKYTFQNTLIGQSEPLKKVFQLAQKAIATNINVSITGETGTGKELIAKAIHLNSRRKKSKFVAINMAAIPKDLAESELFGHEKGAFTGAFARKIGKFEEGNGGTIFLDEIADLDSNLQTKLLRVLQEREVVRVGGNESVSLDIRIITATHKDLREEVREGRFREDLYFRLIGLPIHMPALRNRNTDILLLANHFLDYFSKENKLGKIKLSEAAKQKLVSYKYPGNVRELKAVIELAAAVCLENTIQEDDITFLSARKDLLDIDKSLTLKEHIRGIIAHYLNINDRDILKTASMLDIGKSTIYKMLKDGEL